MRISEDFKLLAPLFIELDPLESGFAGVLLEVHRHGDRCVLLEVAPYTGNRLLRFSSKDRRLVYAVLDRELDELLGRRGPPRGPALVAYPVLVEVGGCHVFRVPGPDRRLWRCVW